jgi:signal transduction histidine kinase/DNA-binding response OmpR family regulator/ligand-binding sensor domain-containing protein
MRKSPFRLFLTLLFCLCLPARAEEFMAFRNLTTADGLVSNQVSAIYRDSRGFLWVGTEEGLDRYDAYRFCSFTTRDGLPGPGISGLAEDMQGRIWVVTSDGSACYSYQDDRFVPAEEALSAMGIRVHDPAAVGSNPDHSFFWVVGEGMIAVYSAAQDRVFEFPVTDSRYLQPCMQEDRLYYADADARLYCANLRTGSREEIPYPDGFRALIADYLPRMYADRRGGLWVYTYRTDVLLHYTPAGGWRRETLPKNEGQFNRITAVAEDSSGDVWVTTSHDGLFLFRTDGTRQQMTHDPDKLFSLPGDNLVALHIDRDDIVWVGNFKLGLSSYAPRSLTLMHFNVGGTNDVLSFCETPDALYLGTDGSGLFRADRYDGTFTPVPTGITVINCITRDSRGDLWLGSWESGLVRLGPDGRKKAVYTSRNSDLGSNSIFSIREGADGGIYLGLYLGAVQRLDPDTGVFTTVFSDPKVTIYDFLSLNDGTLVVGSSAGLAGVDFFPEKTGVSALFQDSRGRLWIAGREGVWFWSPETGRLQRLGRADGLASDSATAITEDRNGRIWIASTHGISSVDLSGEKPFAQHYGLQDGLGWTDFNQRSILTLQDGDILAGTPQGFTAIRPKSTYSNSFDAPIYLTRVDYSDSGRRGLDRTPPLDATKMVIKNDMLPLSLHFSCLDFDRQNTVSYEYQVKGYGDRWLAMQENVVKFSLLPPGRYELSVRACDARGVWSSQVKTLTLLVRRPWYLSWLALVFYALIFLAIVVQFVHHFRKKREYAAALDRINKEAEDQKRLLDMKLNFFANVSHELRTPLSLIINPLDEFTKRYPQYGSGFLSTVRNNAGYLKELIDQLLSFRKMDAGGEQMHYVRSNVVMVLNDVFMGYQTFATSRKIHYGFSAEPQVIQMDFDREKMMKMLHNLLSNAFKFTPDGGRIDVEVQADAEHLHIRVKDTGTGIPEGDRENIFKMFYQVEEQPHPQGGSGIGLYLVDQYVRMHGGRIEVGDNAPQGAVFTIEIPLFADEQESRPDNRFRDSDIKVLQDPQRLLEHAVLLVDDNAEFLDFLGESLASDYRVFRASDGLKALDILREEDIDLVVSDVMMPNMDGLELCRQIKADIRTSHVPVILLTAKSGEEFQLEGLRQGADDYVTKPFNMEILCSRIEKLIEHRQEQYERFAGEVPVEPSRIAVTPLDQQFIGKAIALVEDNLSNEDFSVEELASGLSISRGYLYRKISKITGKSAIEFIRTIRMKRAQQLLVESQLQIAEVAYRLGYRSPKVFSKHFKSVFGVNPSEFVRSWKGPSTDHPSCDPSSAPYPGGDSA